MNYLLPVILTFLVFIVAWGLGFVGYHIVRRISKTQARYWSTVIQFATLIGGLYSVAIYFGISPTVILAVVAIITAGISLAADGAIGNAIAGFVLLSGAKFSIGEQVTLAGVSGVVTDVGFLNTTLQVNTLGLVTLPNSSIVGGQIVNHSRLASTTGVEMVLTLPFYDRHDRGDVVSLIDAVLEGEELRKGSKILHDWVNGGEQYAVVVKVSDYSKRREVMSRLSMRLTTELFKANFPIGSVTFIQNIE